MDLLILFVGVAGSALCDFLAAALRNLPAGVVTTMADEGSAAGKRVKAALDEADETSLAIAVVDALFLVIATAAAATIVLANQDSAMFWTETLAVLIAVTTAKTVASVVGARYADSLMRTTGILLLAVRTITSPIRLAHRMLMRVTQRGTDEEEAREELEALVETAREEGALDPGEYRIMTNIMQLSSIEVTDVMTPRTVVFSMSEATDVATAVKRAELQMYSRWPVHTEGDLDSVSGYVMTKDVLRAALAGRQNVPLSRLKRDVDFIPENITLEKALEQFLQRRQHLFMVVDEHGGVEGLITMEDVLETMLGAEIVDEADHVVDLRALAKQRRDQRVAQRHVEEG